MTDELEQKALITIFWRYGRFGKSQTLPFAISFVQ